MHNFNSISSPIRFLIPEMTFFFLDIHARRKAIIIVYRNRVMKQSKLISQILRKPLTIDGTDAGWMQTFVRETISCIHLFRTTLRMFTSPQKHSFFVTIILYTTILSGCWFCRGAVRKDFFLFFWRSQNRKYGVDTVTEMIPVC